MRQPHEIAVHLPTLAATAAASWVVVTLVHEAVGHGGACVLVGGEARAVSTTEFWCDQVEGSRYRLVVAAGSGANLLTALGGVALLHTGRWPSPTARCFTWLVVATSLFHAGSYMLIGPFFEYGDWSHFIRGYEPTLLWRVGVTAIGFGLCTVGIRFASAPRWQPAFGWAPQEGRGGLPLMASVPLATALAVSTAAGLFSPLERDWALRSAVLAPLVLVWLAGVPATRGGDEPPPGARLPRDPKWLVAATVCVVLFVGVFGPGVGSFAGHALER